MEEVQVQESRVSITVYLSCVQSMKSWQFGYTLLELNMPFIIFDCLCKEHILTETVISLHLHKL